MNEIEEAKKRNKLRRLQFKYDENIYEKRKRPKNIKYIKGLISRSLIAVIFVLGSIIYINGSEDNKKLYQSVVLEDSLPFTKINELYTDLFGSVDLTEGKEDVPVFGSVTYTSIEPYKNGTKLTVGMNEVINVITSGIIVYIGEKDDLGNTIIIQGNDGVDIWYSNITDYEIKVYDYVEAGSILGTSNGDDILLTIELDGKFISYEEYLASI